jgi:hypothetical protein
VGLDETAIGLSPENLHFDFLGHDPDIQPGSQLFGLQMRIAVVNKLPDNLLGPGSTRFGIGTDDYVIVPEIEVIPDGGVHVVVMEFPGLAGQLRSFGHGFPCN